MITNLMMMIGTIQSFNIYNNINFGESEFNLTEIVSNVQNDHVLLIGREMNFPQINTIKNSSMCFVKNGGIPQLTNWTDVQDGITDYVTSNIKPTTSFLIFDMEAWTPVWNTLDQHYQNATIDYINTTFPNLTQQQLLDRSQQSWEETSMELLIFAIDICREIRPNASIGYYGYPGMPYWGNDDDFERARMNNDEMFELWQQVDVLLPSIYMPYISTGNMSILINNLHYVKRKIEEAIRLKNIVNRSDLTIYPYTWHRYHDPFDKNFLQYSDIQLEYEYPYYEKLDGLILWSSETTEDRLNDTKNWFIKNAHILEELN